MQVQETLANNFGPSERQTVQIWSVMCAQMASVYQENHILATLSTTQVFSREQYFLLYKKMR